MPRKAHNVSRQRTRGYAITINGLLTMRARLMRSGRLGEKNADTCQADIAAIDRVLRLAGFDGDIEAITRDYRRNAIFMRGELQRAVLDVLRTANGPMTPREIAARVYGAKGLEMRPGRQSKEWINRVRKVCQRIKCI